MTRIAHLSDLHLLETEHQRRDAAGRFRLSFLSFFRRLDQEERRARVRNALLAYKASGAEHLVVTGDLTEDGTDAQFEVLAEVLADSDVDPNEVTLAPGNHDGYCDAAAFDRALGGPLRAFAPTSRPGAITVLDDVVIVPVSTVIKQPISRSAGLIAHENLHWVDCLATRMHGKGRALAMAQHHPPFGHAMAAVNWIDGLQNHDSAVGLLQRHPELHVLHGHRHRSSDHALVADGTPRVFGATACVDHAAPLRLYEACDGRLWPARLPVAPAAALPVPALLGTSAA
jgi:3',5'-cyclic AMP phosphodiesterase CpdA